MPLPNILPTPNTSRKQSVHNNNNQAQQPSSKNVNNTNNTTSTTPSHTTNTNTTATATTQLTNQQTTNMSKSPPNDSSLHPSSATTSQKRGKVLGMISMFENLNPDKTSKPTTTTSEKIALSNALQDEEKKKRFRARSNSFDLNSPSTASVVTTNSTNITNTANISSQVSNNQKTNPPPNIFHNISKNIYNNINTQLNTNNTNNTNVNNNTTTTHHNTAVNNIKENEEEEKSRLTRTPSMVQGLKARFEKLQFSVLEQLKKEEEWMQKKKERQLTARSHGDNHQSSHRSDTSSCESETNHRNSVELSSHNQKHNDSMLMYDHDIISTDDEYSEEDEQEIHQMMETENDYHQHHSMDENKRRSQEERIHQHVFDTLMISPPPQIVAGMAAQSRQSLFYHELYGETASSSTPSPMDVTDPSSTSSMNNDDWLESQMNRHQRYNISDLDLLTAYRHKSQLYQMQNPANVMMNPFIQDSQVVLGSDAEEEDYAEDGGEYLSSDNDQTDIDPEHRRSSVDMIGGVLDRQSEEEFTSWEKQMEEFGKALVI